ncbi:MAG: hydrolase [Verrucomicrobiota bacterium]
MIDFQPQMLFGVESHPRQTIINNSEALAKAARVFEVPTILTTVETEDFSGPKFAELTRVFPDHELIERSSMNTWDSEEVKAELNRQKESRGKLILAGLWTEVCISMPSLEAMAEGWEVYVVTDACGGTSKEAHDMTIQRVVQAGAVPVTWQQVMLEWQRDWSRKDTYKAVNEIIVEHSGAYGQGIRYAVDMVHGGGKEESAKEKE